MRFGSVEFFKVLIKTVLAIVFFAPLIIAVIFGVLLLNKNKQIDDLTAKCDALTAAAETLVGERIGTADDYCLLFEKSGLSYDELMKLLYKKGELDAQSVYKILSNAGVSDKDLLSAAISKNGTDADSLYATLKGAGLTESQIAAVAELAEKSSGQSRPSASVPSDTSSDNSEPSTSSAVNSEPVQSTTSDTESKPEQPAYMSMYPDMYVDAPTEYVREEKTVYLTFDDGPSKNTGSVLLILRQRGVKATFFVTPGSYGSEAKARLKSIAADGHAIGIHSNTHDYEKIYASVDAFLEDFYEAWTTVYEATGIKTEIFRFPGGSKNDYNVETRDEIIAEMTRRGFRYYDWNVQSNDILGYTWTQMYNKVLSEVKNSNRSIVLFHDRENGAVNVLDDIIGVLQGEGYKFDKINDDTMPMQMIGPFS